MKKLGQYFLRGLLFVVPLAVTLYVSWALFMRIDRILHIPIPGVGFLAAIALITFIGMLTGNIFTKGMLNFIDHIFQQLPFVKLVYNSIKDFVGAFVGDKKAFRKPVYVNILSGSDAKALGYITREDVEHLGLPGHVAVYFPQSYNFAGQVLLFPREQVHPINVNSSELMTFIVSAGITSHQTPPKKQDNYK